MEKAPIIGLANGWKVANFSSPHPFVFETGETLPGCSEERSRALELTKSEVAEVHPKGWIDVVPSFRLTVAVIEEMAAIEGLASTGEVTICLVPFPMLEAIRLAGMRNDLFRSSILTDRVKKTISSTKFGMAK